jgi:hypothetical protein
MKVRVRGGEMYCSTLSLNSSLDVVGCQRNAVAALTPEKDRSLYCTGGYKSKYRGYILTGPGSRQPYRI